MALESNGGAGGLAGKASLDPRRAVFVIRYSLFVILGVVPACKPSEPAAPEAPPAAVAKPADVLIFPNELHVADESVNAFVERAMRVCGDGDYEEFRLLWSAKAEPLPRDEFEQGWQAVERIRIRALRKAIIAGQDPSGDAGAAESPGETVYLVLAEVAFDPDQPAGRREPQREVVLMLRREQGQWRVSRAPNAMRDWIREQVADEGADDDPDGAIAPRSQIDRRSP